MGCGSLIFQEAMLHNTVYNERLHLKWVVRVGGQKRKPGESFLKLPTLIISIPLLAPYSNFESIIIERRLY